MHARYILYQNRDETIVVMISADDVGRMLQRNPSIVAYKSIEELVILKDWFFDFDDTKDFRARAIARVKALNSRGRLPHAIEMTALLALICLKDPQMGPQGSSKENDANILQLSYSMALTRFVNGLLDPLQQSNFAIPLHQLAKSLDIPSYFVELRHMATHENLPSLSMLRIAARGALNWLYDNYWRKIEDIELGQGESDIQGTQLTEAIQEELRECSRTMEELTLNIKVYRTIRKQDLNMVYKFGNSTPDGIKYWKALKRIKTICQSKPELVIRVLLAKDCLITRDESKSKKIISYLELLYKLYNPLIEELGEEVRYKLYETMVSYILSNFEQDDIVFNKELNLCLSSDYELSQLSHWIGFIVASIYNNKLKLVYKRKDIDKNVLLESLVENIEDFPSGCQIIALKSLKNLKLPQPIVHRVDKMLDSATKSIKLRKFDEVESLDSILSEPKSKRTKKESNPDNKSDSTETKHYLFEPHTNWQPTAFGSVV